ncbi:TPA: hypothetical protein ACJETU_001022 [Acinetobacter baumannii]|uniref:hypothetical protein n=1 Tax=Acinetobacter baumannii TaxID=470 RepID=UPI0002BB88F3|nr:hypothetical protein [Acinetobacter baumannii]CAH1073673.1 Uncharacterised protein [Acinetobacter phage MD-2021a]KAF0626505.1 Uncharacterized protein AB71198_03157 [Acinetobacter baumannii]MDI4240173.1 hypothetical protein [Acinetobacter baumannii]MDN8344801.1 hypothetical protein [Acinetobacter baumannii]MDN8348919.1 hypothetical protein [Acinetobacter baumannii]
MTDLNNPETIEIHGLRTITKLCHFGADNNMEGCTFTEIVERLFAELEKAKAQAVQQSFEIGRLQDRITELLDERQDLYAQINNDQAVPDTHIVVPRNREVVVAIEKMVEQQVEASGITSDVFRLDGWRILDAIQEASESGAEQ